jgi:phosphoribosylformimino-5-aminoimidazole carboxamide ribotide isomerase
VRFGGSRSGFLSTASAAQLRLLPELSNCYATGKAGATPSANIMGGSMHIIPVLDLRGGIIVRARMGRRDQYRPLESQLIATCDPVDVMRGFCAVYPFKTFYVADLDAIMGTGNNESALRQLKAAFPAAVLWVDNGVADPSAALRWLDAGLGHLVVGSESQRDAALMQRLSGDDRVVLSLDFREHGFRGPPALLDEVNCWPGQLIVMTLARVGSGSGPDLDRLRAIRDVAAGRGIYAAGGVRDRADLAALKGEGIAGALVATSLHDGRLHGNDLEAM